MCSFDTKTKFFRMSDPITALIARVLLKYPNMLPWDNSSISIFLWDTICKLQLTMVKNKNELSDNSRIEFQRLKS